MGQQMPDREPGWYWVKQWSQNEAVWVVCNWTGAEWLFAGNAGNPVIGFGSAIAAPQQPPPNPEPGWYWVKQTDGVVVGNWTGAKWLFVSRDATDPVIDFGSALAPPQQTPLNREPGFYWVKEKTNGVTVGHWTGNQWFVPATNGVPAINDIGSAIAPPSTSGQPPSQLGWGAWVGKFWWVKTKENPDAWTIGYGFNTDGLALCDAGWADFPGGVYVIDPDALQQPTD